MSSREVTPFQPTLPAEVPWTDAEFAFYDDSPERLFPDNQNSNAGLFRKIFSDVIQILIEQQNLLYNERFIDTSTQYLDEYETMVGLPPNPASKTIQQRRFEVSLRLIRGPFTRARRNEVIERYIAATFGPPVELTAPGLALSAAGVPLYAESGELATSYTVTENNSSGKNLVPNPSFETNTTGWATSGNATAARSTAQNKFGVASALVTATNTSSAWYNTPLIPVTAGQAYSASFWVRRNVGVRQASIQVSWYTVADAFISQANGTATVIPTTSFIQLKLENIIPPPTAAKAYVFLIMAGGTAAANDSYYLDGVQMELGPVATSFKDPQITPFYYEVRILAGLSPDMTGLTRELTRITPAGISYDIRLVSNP